MSWRDLVEEEKSWRSIAVPAVDIAAKPQRTTLRERRVVQDPDEPLAPAPPTAVRGIAQAAGKPPPPPPGPTYTRAPAGKHEDEWKRLLAGQGEITAAPTPTASPATVGRGFLNTFKVMNESGKQAVGDLVGAPFLNESQNRASENSALRDLRQAVSRQETGRPQFDNPLYEGLYGAVESTIMQLPGIAASIAAGNPAPGLAWAGSTTGLQGYGKYRARGATPGEAGLGATGEGAVEVATELIPMGSFIKAFGKEGGQEFLKQALKATVQDVPGEQIATLAQDAIDTAIANPDKTWDEYVKERPEAALVTAIATVGQGAIMTSGGYAANRLQAKLANRTPRERAEAEAIASITPEDEASPIDTADIIAGRAEMAVNAAAETADSVLGPLGMPKVGKPVIVTTSDGKTLTGTMENAFKIETNEYGSSDGISVRLADGSLLEGPIDELRDRGLTITEDSSIGAQFDATSKEVAAAFEQQFGPRQAPAAPTWQDIAEIDSGPGFSSPGQGPRTAPSSRPSPVGDGGAIVRSIFGDKARITSTYRGPNHPLTLKNPKSWHSKSRAAVDMAPIPGMTFAEAKAQIEAQGYTLLEALNEVGSGKTKHATGDHWHFVIGKGGTNSNSADLAAIPGENGSTAGNSQTTPDLEAAPDEESPSTAVDNAAAMAMLEGPAEPAQDIAGEKIDDEWVKFKPESGTLDIPRADMPQIKAENRGAMVNFLNARGIEHAEDTVAASSLKPTQSEFSTAKVQKAKDFEGGDRAILVSQDGHVVDGHHQWLAARDKGEDIRVIRLGAPVRDIINTVADMPSTVTAEGADVPKVEADPEARARAIAVQAVRDRRDTAGIVQGASYNFGEALSNSTRGPKGQFSTPGKVHVELDEPGRSSFTFNEKDIRAEASAPSAPTSPQSAERAATAPIPRAPSTSGASRADTAVTTTGREIPVEYAVVDLKNLVTSHNQDGAVNPAFPAELQPRDRSRDASATQIADIAARLDPRLLGQTPKASDGAPIISPSGVVESGNGRTLAIGRAYDLGSDRAEAYRQFVAEQGFDISGIERPVLVRVRQNDMGLEDVEAFTREANQRDTAGFSATEQAVSDARALPASVLSRYRGGDLDTAGNRDFVRAFISAVVPESERASMIASDGSMSQDAMRRIGAAMVQRAYGNPQLVAKLSESTDNNIKAIGGALSDVSTAWAEMVEAAREGAIDPAMDITANLNEAVELVDRARREGKKVADLVAQTDIFSGDKVSPMTEAVLYLMFRNRAMTQPFGREKLAEQLRWYVAEAMQSRAEAGLFGEAGRTAPGEVLSAARNRIDDKQTGQQPSLLDRPDAGNGEGVRQGSEPRAGNDGGQLPRTEQEGGGQSQRVASESTAPEHAQVGVDDRELSEIVEEFNDAQGRMVEGDEKITHIFDAPAKSEVVRLNDKVRVYHKDHGWMTPAEAREKIRAWEDHAVQQGRDPKTRGKNGDKVVLSLFDLSGEWSMPWEQAGYDVWRFDIQADPEMGDVNNFSADFFGDWFGDFEGRDVYAILAANPCTDFAVSGARHFAAKDADGRTVASVKLVHQTLATIEYFKPAVWAIENPVGRIEKLGGLPPWRLSFDPNHVGETYTKKTLIWGRFNADLPIAPVDPVEGSKMHKQYGGKSLATKNARSVTPEGFAYSFFMANNAADHPAMAISNKFDRLDGKLIEQAVKAGVTEEEITNAVEDYYYQELDDEAANEAIRALIDTADQETTDIGEALAARIADDFAGARAEYETIDNIGGNSEGGRVLNTDIARELSPEYRADRSRATEVHTASSNFIKKLYAQKLKEPAPDGFDDIVLFTAGGAGAGKSTGMELVPDSKRAGLVYDTTMDKLDSSVSKIEQALEAGWVVKILYTFRDPLEALENGALQRAERVGRTVPIDVLVNTHLGARRVIDELAARYKNDMRVDFIAIDNSRGKDNAAIVPLEDVPPLTDDRLLERAERIVQDAYDKGRITAATLGGTLEGRTGRSGPDTKGNEPRDRPGGRGQPEQERQGAARQGLAASEPQEDTPPAAKPVPSANTAFTDDAYQAAKRRMAERKSRLNSGVDPEMLLDAVVMAGYHIEKGARTFAAYAEAFLADMAEAGWKRSEIIPHLRQFYENVRYDPRTPKDVVAGMSGPEDIGAALARLEDAANDDTIASDETATDQRDGSANRGGMGSPGEPETAGNGRPDGLAAGEEADSPLAGSQPEDGGGPRETEPAGTAGVRTGRQDARAGEGVPESGDAADGREGASGAGLASQGARGRNSGGVSRPDFSISDPAKIIGGTPKVRFANNQAAIEAYERVLDKGREPTKAELQAMAGYTGWGSFGQELFQGTWERPMPKDNWANESDWLRSHMGEENWKSAQASIINAHYTDPPTVQAMWAMVEKLGFKGGRVLEPSMGIGNFFSLMPKRLRDASNLTGIEMDKLTGGMAKMLFPNSTIHVMPYQDSRTPDDFYDLVIGNWPFDREGPADRRYMKLAPSLHDFFFLKALDQTRPGGLVVGVTSSGTMDKLGRATRMELAKKADLVAAFRLPTGAFEEYAGTMVVTDILVLQKREKPLADASNAGWINTVKMEAGYGQPPLNINEYWEGHPDAVLGKLGFGRSTMGRPGLMVTRPDDLRERLAALPKKLKKVYAPAERGNEPRFVTNNSADRHGSITTNEDGNLYQVQGERLVRLEDIAPRKLTTKDVAQAKALVGLRKGYAGLIDAERDGADNVEDLRKALNRDYQAFRKAHGPVTDSLALKLFKKLEDPGAAILAALEKPDGSPSQILTQPMVRSARRLENPSVLEAFVFERNKGVGVNIEEIAKQAGTSAEQAANALLDSKAVYRTPGGGYEVADVYLSGNVRQKLAEAKLAEGQGEDMAASIAALEGVIPENIPYYQIEAKLGATWVPGAVYEQFVADLLNASPDKISIKFIGGRWQVELKDRALDFKSEATTQWGTERIAFGSLLRHAFNNTSPKLQTKDSDGNTVLDEGASQAAAEKATLIREEFGNWVFREPLRRVELERAYNEIMNAIANPQYDGSFLEFPGMALEMYGGPLSLRSHQVNAVWQGLATGRGLFAHEVGTGKTLTIGGIAVEGRRFGIHRKPLVLAHNANSATVAAEINEMYPGAAVLYVDNLSPDTIDTTLRRIRNEDWDAVVMPHSVLDRITLSRATLDALAADEIALLEEEALKAAEDDNVALTVADMDDPDKMKKVRSVTAKNLVHARNRIIANIEKQAIRAAKDGAVLFEELGIDAIIVDEAHVFKKPPISTRMQLKGLNTATSNRSIALNFLTGYTKRNRGGQGVYLFTGTPITNTLTEIFNMQRYVMDDVMAKDGIDQWDAWFNTFADASSDVELNAAGEYEPVTRLASFVNVAELRRMAGQFLDIVFADDMPEFKPRETPSGKKITDADLTEDERANLVDGRADNPIGRPYKKIINDVAPMGEAQSGIMDILVARSKKFRNATKKERRELMLKGDPSSPVIVETDAANASLDVRLYEEAAPDEPQSKVNRAAANIVRHYREHKMASQVVFMERGFSDTATRKGEKVKRLNLAKDLTEKLVSQGIPRNQIAIVDGSTSKVKRKEIASKMKRAEIRVVIGSTATLGTGVNMQDNMRAMHHLDAPWMPGELEQRNGRGWRQGNHWNTVLEYRYITEKLDGRRWQVLAVKDRFIKAFLKADQSVRIIDGDAVETDDKVGADELAQTLADAAGDPRLLMVNKLKNDVTKLERRERSHTYGVADAVETANNLEAEIAKAQAELPPIEQDAAHVEKLRETGNFKAKVAGKTYSKRPDAEEAIALEIRDVRGRSLAANVGPVPVDIEVNGFKLTARKLRYGDVTFSLERTSEYRVNAASLRGMEATIRGVQALPTEYREWIEEKQTSVKSLRASAKAPFAQAESLAKRRSLLASIEQDLQANPVPPPQWLRAGAPVNTEIYVREGEALTKRVVEGHRWTNTDWIVSTEQGEVSYSDALDVNGLPIYEGREFQSPVVEKPVAEAKQSLFEEPDQPERTMTQAQRAELEARQKQGMARRGGQKPIADQDGGLFSAERDQGSLFRRSAPQGAGMDPDALQARLEGYLGRKAALRVVETLNGAAGSYRDGLIEIATNTPQDGTFTLDHEAVHALRDLGVFSQSEWAILAAKAKRDPALMRSIRRRYSRLDAEAQSEEAVADMFARWQRGDYQTKGTANRIFAKLRNLFEAIRNAFAGRGLQSAEGVMSDIASGDVGNRDAVSINRDEDFNSILEQTSASWSDERIGNLLRQYAVSHNETKTKSYVARLAPSDFINATTPFSEQEQLRADAGALDRDQLAAEDQTPFLIVEDKGDGFFQIVGHEGRHRMAALDGAGVESVPVVVQMRDIGWSDLQEINETSVLWKQNYSGGVSGALNIRLNRMVPLTYANRETIKAEFGQPDAAIRYSIPEEPTPGFKRDEMPPPGSRTGYATAGPPMGGPGFADPDTEARYQDARKGISTPESLVERTRGWLTEGWHGLSRHWINLPNTPEYADLQQKLRAMEAAPGAAKERTVRLLEDMVSGFDTKELDLFTRKVILDDLSWETSQEHDLPFGLTPETVRSELAKIDAILHADPDRKVWKAVMKRRVVNRDIARQLVDAGVLEAEAIKNPAYYRHQVLEYARAQQKFAHSAGSKLRSPKWARRMGSTLDINANLLEAEFDWLNKALMDIPIAKSIDWIKKSKHNILDDLKKQARERNKAGIETALAEAKDRLADGKGDEQDALLIESWKGAARRIAMGFGGLAKVIEDGDLRIPPYLQAAADSLSGARASGEPPFALLNWILDNNHPGSMEAAMIYKGIGLRNQIMRSVLGRNYADPMDVKGLLKTFAPEGYTTWQPDEGKLLFTVKTLPEHVIDGMLEKITEAPPSGIDLEAWRAELEKAKSVLVVGGDRYTMILPQDVADTLNSLRLPERSALFDFLVEKPVRAWKRWVLINPRRWFKYNLNNTVGDLDALIAGNPRALTRVGQAVRELYAVMKNGERPTARYEEAIERGVFDSGVSVQEIPDINQFSAFERFAEGSKTPTGVAKLVLRKAWNTLQGTTQFRENVFRYAAYLDYVDRIEAGNSQAGIGYGASLPSMVDAVTDPKDRAALLARDLIGDYGAISHFGSGVRRTIIPFWSWMEMNTKRYKRLSANAWSQGVGKGLATSGLAGATLGLRVTAALAVRAALIYGAIQMWNYLFFDDEEDEIDDQQGHQLHIILGRNAAGEVVTLRTQGALSDALSWFGFPEIANAFKEYERGRGSLGEILAVPFKTTANKLLTSMSPSISVPLESALGKKLWPDVFNPRPNRDPWRNLASTFSLENELDLARDLVGAPSPDRGYGRSWQESVIYRRDPGEIAYNAARGIAYDWKRRVLGQDSSSDFTSPRADAMRDYRSALKFGDTEAADAALDEMAALGVTVGDYNAMIKRAHPLAPIAKKDRKAFVAGLTDSEYETLLRAEEWYFKTFGLPAGDDAEPEAEE